MSASARFGRLVVHCSSEFLSRTDAQPFEISNARNVTPGLSDLSDGGRAVELTPLDSEHRDVAPRSVPTAVRRFWTRTLCATGSLVALPVLGPVAFVAFVAYAFGALVALRELALADSSSGAARERN